MTEIHVTNTPIFDALMREHNIIPSLSANSSLRPSKGLSLAKKPVLPTRAPGAALPVEEPQKGFPDLVEVKPLQSKIEPISDSLMFHGITAKEALENASHFPGYVQSVDNPHVFVKATTEVLFQEKVDLAKMDFESEGSAMAWMWKVSRDTIDNHPDHANFETALQGEWDGTHTFTITAIRRTSEEKAA